MPNESQVAGVFPNPYEEISQEEVAAVSNLQILSILLVTFLVYLSRKLRLDVERELFIGAIRCFVQISVLGIILVPIILQNNPFVVIVFITIMVFMAAIEASLRPAYEYPGMALVCFVSIAATVVINCTLVLGVALQTGLHAQYAIPLAGIIIGQAMEAVSVGLAKLVEQLAERTQDIEVLVALGATRWEACFDVVRSSVVLGLSPALTLMTVAGLVFVPELMTGHILGGTRPTVAGDYQLIVIYFGVGSAIFSSCIASLLTIAILFDSQVRFKRGKLVKRHKEDRIATIIATTIFIWTRFRRWRRSVLERGTMFPRRGGEIGIDMAAADIPLVAQMKTSRTYGSQGQSAKGDLTKSSGVNR